MVGQFLDVVLLHSESYPRSGSGMCLCKVHPHMVGLRCRGTCGMVKKREFFFFRKNFCYYSVYEGTTSRRMLVETPPA